MARGCRGLCTPCAAGCPGLCSHQCTVPQTCVPCGDSCSTLGSHVSCQVATHDAREPHAMPPTRISCSQPHCGGRAGAGGGSGLATTRVRVWSSGRSSCLRRDPQHCQGTKCCMLRPSPATPTPPAPEPGWVSWGCQRRSGSCGAPRGAGVPGAGWAWGPLCGSLHSSGGLTSPRQHRAASLALCPMGLVTGWALSPRAGGLAQGGCAGDISHPRVGGPVWAAPPVSRDPRGHGHLGAPGQDAVGGRTRRCGDGSRGRRCRGGRGGAGSLPRLFLLPKQGSPGGR